MYFTCWQSLPIHSKSGPVLVLVLDQDKQKNANKARERHNRIYQNPVDYAQQDITIMQETHTPHAGYKCLCKCGIFKISFKP